MAEPIRVIALGQFHGDLPPLAPRLAALPAEPVRCAGIEQLPAGLGARDILLTDMVWLNALTPPRRAALQAQCAKLSGWVALTDGKDRFKDQVDWQRAGVTHFFGQPVDADRLAALVEDVHDRMAGPPVRAILVDDDQASLDFYGAILREAGIEVLATTDPLLVVDALDESSADVLVVDIEMPGCRGTELVAILRRQNRFARLPAIYLTAHQDIGRQLQARTTAAEDFLVKPVAPELLVEAVKAQAWRSRSRQREEALRRDLEHRARWKLEQLRMAIDEHAIVSIARCAGRHRPCQ